MKEYYRNCDPDEKDQIEDDKPLCERRILHVVSTALSYGTLKNAILFTFDDHPIIPELVKNPKMTLDDIIEEKKMKLDDKENEEEMEELINLEILLNDDEDERKEYEALRILLKSKDEDDEDIVKILKKIRNICNKFVLFQ